MDAQTKQRNEDKNLAFDCTASSYTSPTLKGRLGAEAASESMRTMQPVRKAIGMTVRQGWLVS
jgi:hypothetical protein